jgi:malate dehydrogenase (oxaloacetate-decarboxylating)(NADP+)
MAPTALGSEAMRGIDILRNPATNKGSAFSLQERRRVGLLGLLPARVETIEQQVMRVLENVRSKPTPIEKYAFLCTLQDSNETLYFRTLIDNLDELLPIVYTPTVGQACIEWSRRHRQPRGLHISSRDRGRVREVLGSWPEPNVRVIVVTDGGRILGLGDLGANGMGIPIGKLALYVACAGVHPSACLPVMLDVGTDTAAVRNDPYYLGLHEPRLARGAYDELVDEFVEAARDVFPGVLLQFEDFANANAFRLLTRYRQRLCSFNDDIQGSGAMGLAGLYAVQRMLGTRLSDQRLLFFGAGEAGIGIGTAIVSAMMREGQSEAAARSHCWFIDSKGLLVTARDDLATHKRPFVQDHMPLAGLLSAVETFRPSVLIGASGQPGAFTQPVLSAMARLNDRPVILALSNPTTRTECTPEQVFHATGGRAIFATGSPFPPLEQHGRTYITGQANNSFIFPGLGLGVLVSGARTINDEMFIAAARALADQVDSDDLACGRIFPPATRLREVAAAVADAVADAAYTHALAGNPRPENLAAAVRAPMYRAEYA